MAERRQGTCPACKRPRALTSQGLVVGHSLAWAVSARAVRSVGAGRASVRCPGSGRPPAEAG